jgi:FixJ family two-component response regulator
MGANETMRLAIVDDDEGARSGIARLLRSLGHHVQSFASAEAVEAADAADLAAVDCLIVDVRLPGVGGPELRDRLRSRGALTPIVFITGDAVARTRDSGRAGTVTVIKPFDDSTLMAAVAAAISDARSSGARHAG